MRSRASRSFGDPSDAAIRSRRCDSISRTASRTTSIGRNVLSDRSRTNRYPLTRDWPVSVRFTVILPRPSARRRDESIDFFRERAPFSFHLAQPSRAGLRQPVVFARMRGFALHPARLEQSFLRQPSEDRIDRSFADDEVGERLEMLNDGEAVARPVDDRQQNREVKTAAPELFEPGFARHTLCHKASTKPAAKSSRTAKKAGRPSDHPACPVYLAAAEDAAENRSDNRAAADLRRGVGARRFTFAISYRPIGQALREFLTGSRLIIG